MGPWKPNWQAEAESTTPDLNQYPLSQWTSIINRQLSLYMQDETYVAKMTLERRSQINSPLKIKNFQDPTNPAASAQQEPYRYQ